MWKRLIIGNIPYFLYIWKFMMEYVLIWFQFIDGCVSILFQNVLNINVNFRMTSYEIMPKSLNLRTYVMFISNIWYFTMKMI